jgi:hypothetical protein
MAAIQADVDALNATDSDGGPVLIWMPEPGGTAGDLCYASNDAAGSAVAMCNSPHRGPLAAVAWPLDDFAGRVDGGSVRVLALNPALSECDDASLGDTLNPPAAHDSLLTVIANWGECAATAPSCAGDVDASGAVDIDDLRKVIEALWQ